MRRQGDPDRYLQLEDGTLGVFGHRDVRRLFARLGVDEARNADVDQIAVVLLLPRAARAVANEIVAARAARTRGAGALRRCRAGLIGEPRRRAEMAPSIELGAASRGSA